MAAVSKGESLLYKDARSYCARRHMNTMWKSMRVDRRFESLLDKQVYHIDKARSYRSRELDQEQELFLENLTSLFERQCEIAAGKLELEIAEQLLKNQKSSADARLRGSRRKSLKRMKSFTVPIHNVMTESEVHVVPGCEHERRARSTLGENYRVSSAQSFGRQSREQFVRGFEDPNDGRKSACCGQDDTLDDNDLRKKNRARISQIFQTEDQTDRVPSRMAAHESMLIEPLHRPSSKRKGASSRPGGERQAVSWGKPTSKVPGSHPVGYHTNTTAEPPRKPAWSRHRDNVFGRQPYKPSSATGGGRCSKCEPTIAWEIVPRNKRINKPKTASSKLQSTRFQPGQRDKNVDEETLFRKQFLACAMSRFLPISALRGASFGEHDDVRKKMEGRRRCLEELKQRHRMQFQNAPPPRHVTMSKASDDGTTTRATSSYTKTPGNDDQRSSKNDTPGNFFSL